MAGFAARKAAPLTQRSRRVGGQCRLRCDSALTPPRYPAGSGDAAHGRIEFWIRRPLRGALHTAGAIDRAARCESVRTTKYFAACWRWHSGAFADSEGNAWEVAHNPHWTLAEDGSVSL